MLKGEVRRGRTAVSRIEARFARLFEHAPVLVALLQGPEHHFRMANPAFRELVGERQLLDLPFADALPELREQGLVTLLDRVFSEGEPVTGKSTPKSLQRISGAPSEKRYVDFVYQPVLDAKGRTWGVLILGTDVTQRVLATKRQQTSLEELVHRSKNNLAVVQALARQTAREYMAPPGFLRAFEDRLSALAVSNHALIDTTLNGASLEELLRRELSPFGLSRFHWTGPYLGLAPEQASGLSMVVHELATNAVKYGALADSDGQVTIRWKGDQGRLSALEWTERKTTPTQPFAHVGFGLELIARVADSDLHARFEPEWGATGLVARLTWPV